MDTVGTKRSYGLTTEDPDLAPQGPSIKANKRCDAQVASQRHIKTEQARRDKISAGFQALQELLPGREKVEKAMLLGQAVDYIQQLQDVLQSLMSSGLVSQLPDNLQWQIRTLLPRRDGKSLPSAPAPAPARLAVEPLPLQHGLRMPAPLGFATSCGTQISPQPLNAQNAYLSRDQEASKDESAILAQMQALLQQQQQQVVAAQQLQTWQQTLQALQLQQVLQQQGQVLPDLVNGLCGLGSATASSPFATLPLPFQLPQASAPTGSCLPASAAPPAAKHPADCFVDELPRCGLQQLVDAAACEQAEPNRRGLAPSPHKARKSNVKVRRHTTAARIPKPTAPNPTRPLPGRPEFVYSTE